MEAIIMASNEHVLVAETRSLLEAELYRELLEEAGIAVRQQEVVNPWLSNAVTRLATPRVQLLVAAEDAAPARELVDDYRRQVEAGEFVPVEDDAGQAPAVAVSSTLRSIGITLVAAFLIAVLLLHGYSTISQELPHDYPVYFFYD